MPRRGSGPTSLIAGRHDIGVRTRPPNCSDAANRPVAARPSISASRPSRSRRTVSERPHRLAAVARDPAGRSASSSPAALLVDWAVVGDQDRRARRMRSTRRFPGPNGPGRPRRQPPLPQLAGFTGLLKQCEFRSDALRMADLASRTPPRWQAVRQPPASSSPAALATFSR